MLSRQKGKLVLTFVFLFFLAIIASSANGSNASQQSKPGNADISEIDSISLDETDFMIDSVDVDMTEFDMSTSLNADSLIKIGVGMLATVLFVISLLAYYRERRLKFLMLTLAFFMFALKGALGVAYLLYQTDSSFLIPLSDLLDFLILLFFVMAILKE